MVHSYVGDSSDLIGRSKKNVECVESTKLIIKLSRRPFHRCRVDILNINFLNFCHKYVGTDWTIGTDNVGKGLVFTAVTHG